MPPQVATTIWPEILDQLRVESPALFRAWLLDISPPELSRGVLTIIPRNEFQASYLNDTCRQRLAEIAQTLTGRIVTIQVAKPDESGIEPLESPNAELLTEETAANQTLDSFVVGPENALAFGAAQAVLAEPGTTHNPLLIIGPSSVGKTHLLRAIASEAANVRPPIAARYVASLSFVTEFIDACENDQQVEFRTRFAGLEILALDDVQELAHRDRSQEAFFHIFQAMIQTGRQVVLSVDRPPQAIAGLADRLASRFAGGLVATIEPPCFEMRLQLAAALAERLHMELPADARQEIADHAESAAAIVELLRKSAAESAAGGLGIDLAMIRRVLARQRPVAAPAVFEAVCRRLGLENADLTRRRQPRTHKLGRAIATFLVRRHTDLDLSVAAKLLNLSTAELLDASRQVETEASRDPKLRALLDEIALDAKNAAD